MAKKMCKEDKDERPPKDKEKYKCKKCGLKAAKEKHLCKPKEL